MKFTKSSIFALGALFALAFTACSDDDKYEVGKPSHGAYFAQNLPTTYQVAPEVTDIADVAVYRVDTESPSTYQLSVSVSPSTDAINVPASITFQGNALATSLPITYDPAKIVKDQPYKVTISIVGATDYGTGTYSFTFTCGDKAETEAYGDGLVTYYYSLFWSGTDPDLPITHSYVVGKESKQIFTISDWGYGVDFNINVDYDVEYNDGSVRATVAPQFTGYHYNDGSNEGDIWVADGYHYWVDARGMDAAEVESYGYLDASYFDPASGEFGLYLKYYLVESPNLGFTMDYEYAVCGKYGDYSVAVNFLGTFTDPTGETSAMASVTSGADVSAVKAICVAGSDVEAALNKVLEGAEGVIDVAVGENVQAYFPVAEGGEHTIVVVSYDGDEPKSYDDVTFNIATGAGGGEASDWKKLGDADYADGWVLPALTVGGEPINNLEFMWNVPVTQSKSNPNSYRMVGMYNQEFLAGVNDYPKYAATREVEINIYENGFVEVDPQECGLGFSTYGGEFLINNPEGFYYVNNEADGVTREEIAAFMASKDIAATVFEGGVFEFPCCWFGAPGLNSTAYNWKSPQTGYLILPDASAAAKRRVKAARIAAPKFNGYARVAANKLQKNENAKMLINQKKNFNEMTIKPCKSIKHYKAVKK